MIEETIDSLARLVDGRVLGDGSRRIVGLGDLRNGQPDRIGFLRSASYIEAARTSEIGALLTYREVDTPATQVVVPNVDAAFARIAQHFHPQPRAREHELHPTAVVEDGVVLHEPVQVGPHAFVGAGSEIGAGSVIMTGVHIGRGCRLGKHTVLHPHVVVHDGVQMGDECLIHAGAKLGGDGFGNAFDGRNWIKIPQLGGLVIGNDVEIGANSTIDRGALGITSIGDNCRIDNLVHIGHNCTFGEAVAVAGLSAFSGSVTVHDRVVFGGHVVVAGHLEFVEGVRVGGNTGLIKSLLEPGDYMGTPTQKKTDHIRTLAATKDLVNLRREVHRLRIELEELRGAAGD